MKTSEWGPHGWFYHHTVTFNYPEEINDNSSEDDLERKKYTAEMLVNLQYTLPCKYCRASWKVFLKELPIEPALCSRKALTFWFYQMHNKVNNKLRTQEQEAVDAKLNELEVMVKDSKISYEDAMKELTEFVAITMITGPDPTYEEVCLKYEKCRASTCTKPKTKVFSCRK